MIHKGFLDARLLVAGAASIAAAVVLALDIRIHAALWAAMAETDGPMPEIGDRLLLLLALPLAAIALTLIAAAAAHRRTAARLATMTRARSQLENGLESIRDGICIWDREHRLVTWNERYAEITGYLPNPLVAGTSFSTIIRDSARGLFPDMDEAGREAWARSREAALDRADGTPRRFVSPSGRLIEVADLRTRDGDIVTNLRDITERDLARRRIEESEALFHDGIENMADGFMLWDGQDRLAAYNGRATEMMPHLIGMELIGRTFPDFAAEAIARARPDLTETQRVDWLRARLERRSQGKAFEVTLGDGRIIEAVERPTSQGGRVTILRDVTEERRARITIAASLAAERETNAQQRRFVSIAGHEFRTPLAIIDSSTQRLEARLGKAPLDEMRLRLGRIREAIGRMTAIIDMTLTSARLDDGRIAAAIAPFDPSALMREVIVRQRSISPRFEIALEVHEPATEIAGDRALVEQIFTNLLSNAAKYSPHADLIEVTITPEGDEVAVAVRDYGVGIPADEVDKLFTRFFRARTATGIAGTGIGLHLVHELLQLQGGRIDVRSELGRGSTFTVHLPRASAAAEPLRAAS